MWKNWLELLSRDLAGSQVDAATLPPASWPTWQLQAKIFPGICWKCLLEIYPVTERGPYFFIIIIYINLYLFYIFI